jgi:WXG100 family type VII secretion target
MAKIHVDYEQLERSASRLRDAQQDIEGQLGRLKTMIDGLVESGFSTEVASGKFRQSYEQWNTGAKNVIGGLEGMNGFLKRAIQQHRDLDSQLGQSSGG